MLLSTKVCKSLNSTLFLLRIGLTLMLLPVHNGRSLNVITTYNVSYTVIILIQICYITTILNAISDQILILNFGVSMFHTFTAVTITLLHTKWDAEFRGPSILHHFSLLYNYCIRVSFSGHTTICCHVLPATENTSKLTVQLIIAKVLKTRYSFIKEARTTSMTFFVP